jgi:type IV secretory pathway TrbL component
MNENEEPREVQKDKILQPAEPVIPKAYRLGSASKDFLHSISHSGLAWLSLLVARLVSAVGCLAILVFGAYEFLVGVVMEDTVLILCSLIGTPVAFVFVRVAELESR